MHPNLSHPLFKLLDSPIQGRGAFAGVDIPPDTRIIEYVGERIDKRESLARCEQNNPFIFCLDETYDIDGSGEENLARYINHSCSPNAVADVIEGRIWIVSLQRIPAGQEITFNYGYDLEDYRSYPCHCGSSNCVGYIVADEFIPLLRRKQRTRGWTAAASPNGRS